ncbi:MAG: sugar ABC transporter permease [Spirochaetes bacterium]|nr:sugar ABC transporter permease [Spirochaetota bacterium]
MSTAAVTAPRKRLLALNTQTITMIVILVVIWILFGALTNWIFLSARNLSNLFRQMTIIGFLACGMVLVIVTGRIDLSVGSVTGFISVIAARLQADFFPEFLPRLFPGLANNPLAGIISTILTIVCTMGIGVLVGIFQGIIIAYLEVPAFIVTLGGMLMFRGGVIFVTRGESIMPIEDSLRLIGQGYLPDFVGLLIAAGAAVIIFYIVFSTRARQRQYGFTPAALWKDALKAFAASGGIIGFVFIMNSYRGLQSPVLLLAVTVVAMSYITTSTRFGRYSYAIGGNVEATRLSGINIKKNVFLIFVLMGFLCAVSGIVLTGYLASGSIGAGTDYELKAIAACILGGTSPLGGAGTIVGAIIGALIMGSLETGISVMNLPVFWTKVVPGLVLILATYLDVTTRRRRG